MIEHFILPTTVLMSQLKLCSIFSYAAFLKISSIIFVVLQTDAAADSAFKLYSIASLA